MNYRDIITIEPGKRGGRPCIRGMRMTVYDVLEYLAAALGVGAMAAPSRTAGTRIAQPAAATFSYFCRLRMRFGFGWSGNSDDHAV